MQLFNLMSLNFLQCCLLFGLGSWMVLDCFCDMSSGTPRDKLCDDSPVELEVQARAQWALLRPNTPAVDLQPPLALSNPLLMTPVTPRSSPAAWETTETNDKWLSQVNS